MLIWVVFSLAGVVLVKYYTSNEMHKLERRLATAKNDLHRIKRRYEEVQEERNEVAAEAALQEERIRSMKELIQDINIRLTARDASEEDLREERVRGALNPE